jgi:type VI secretion system protein
MSPERTLFERLARPKAQTTPTTVENPGETVRSVLQHLQKMLNSRQGHAPAQMDYGILDPSEVVHALPEAVGRLQRSIRECISRYEPRLTSVQVIPVESERDPFILHFQIVGQLATVRERVPVCFDTLVDPSGRIRVRD